MSILGSEMHKDNFKVHTNEEKPGKGARDRALLFITIWPPLRVEADAPDCADIDAPAAPPG